MKTVLVTGASGFVGGHVVAALARRGLRPRCLVRRTSRLDFIRAWAPEFVQGDVADPASLPAAVAGVDGIVHCAGVTRAASPAEYDRVNADGCGHFYAACAAHNPGVQRIVHVGSLAAWGPATAEAPVREDTAPHPVSAYGRSKLAGQRAAEQHRDRLPIVILAPPAVYGPNDRDLLHFFAWVQRGVVPLIGRADRWLSLIHAADLAEAAVACLTHPAAAGRTYLVEDGAPHSWREVGAAMGRALQRAPREICLPPAAARALCAVLVAAARCTGRKPLFNSDKLTEMLQPAWTCSGARLRAELGWTPRLALEPGLADTVRWYREHHWL